jgi:hypothetical protein
MIYSFAYLVGDVLVSFSLRVRCHHEGVVQVSPLYYSCFLDPLKASGLNAEGDLRSRETGAPTYVGDLTSP